MTLIKDTSYKWVNPKVTNDTEYHHMPDHQKPVNLCGLTVRQALKKLREVDFGDIGGTHVIELSDGSYMHVCLRECNDGTSLMSSQYVWRYTYDQGRPITVAKYKL